MKYKTCPHCSKTTSTQRYSDHLRVCVRNPQIGYEVREWMKTQARNGVAISRTQYERTRPRGFPSETSLRSQFESWNEFVSHFCGLKLDTRYRNVPRKFRAKPTKAPVVCDCGNFATRFDVKLGVGIGVALYNLCEDCYELEFEPVLTGNENLYNR